jgi:hypothetical protein
MKLSLGHRDANDYQYIMKSYQLEAVVIQQPQSSLRRYEDIHSVRVLDQQQTKGFPLAEKKLSALTKGCRLSRGHDFNNRI